MSRSHIPTTELTTSNMFNNIWNPFFPLSQSLEQEEPLDLSMKEKNVKNKEEALTLPSSTYYAISICNTTTDQSYTNGWRQGDKEEETFSQLVGMRKKSEMKLKHLLRLITWKRRLTKRTKPASPVLKTLVTAGFATKIILLRWDLKQRDHSWTWLDNQLWHNCWKSNKTKTESPWCDAFKNINL